MMQYTCAIISLKIKYIQMNLFWRDLINIEL